jgi:hypothetical protein
MLTHSDVCFRMPPYAAVCCRAGELASVAIEYGAFAAELARWQSTGEPAGIAGVAQGREHAGCGTGELPGAPRGNAANFAGNFVVGGVGGFKAMGRRRSPARQGRRSPARQRPASAMAALRSVEEEEQMLLPARADNMLGAYANVC